MAEHDDIVERPGAAPAEGGEAALAVSDAPASVPEPQPVTPLGLTAIGPVANDRHAREWALVLQSMSIWHALQRTLAGWLLLVRDEDYDRAWTSIERYEVENRDWPPRPVRERLRFAPSPVAALMFAALAAFFVVTGPVRPVRWFTRGQSVADLVLSTEPWRAVTALTLHADAVHVFGNVISGAIFGSAVQRRLGPGGGALAILASGVAGNVANAFWHQAKGNGGHASIGASTAVFGAVGILAATQVLVTRSALVSTGANRNWVQLLGPLIGGLALLGALGASPRADLGAHLFGFLAGVVVGGAAALAPEAPWWRRSVDAHPRWWVQPLLGAIATAVVLGCWQLAVPLRLGRL